MTHSIQFQIKKVLILVLVLMGLSLVALKVYRKLYARYEVAKTLKSKHWLQRYDDFVKQPRTEGRIVFFGNSLTERFNLSVFGDSTIINRGISGDFTRGLLKRIDEVISLHPSKLFIEIGINDIFAKVPPGEIKENYEDIIKRIKKDSPKTKIYIQSNLPVLRKGTLTSCTALNKTIRQQNERLQRLAENYGATFINLHDLFEKNGALDPHLSADGVHINNFGYDIWKKALLPYLKD